MGSWGIAPSKVQGTGWSSALIFGGKGQPLPSHSLPLCPPCPFPFSLPFPLLFPWKCRCGGALLHRCPGQSSGCSFDSREPRKQAWWQWYCFFFLWSKLLSEQSAASVLNYLRQLIVLSCTIWQNSNPSFPHPPVPLTFFPSLSSSSWNPVRGLRERWKIPLWSPGRKKQFW